MPRVGTVLVDCYGPVLEPPALAPASESYFGSLGVPSELVRAAHREFHKSTSPAPDAQFVTHRVRFHNVAEMLCSRFGVGSADNLGDMLLRAFTRAPFTTGAIEGLQRLRDSRYRLILVTNSDDDLVRQAIHPIAPMFSAVVTSESVRAYKPSPKLLQEAIRISEEPTQQLTSIGDDHDEDCVPAIQLGIAAIWLYRYLPICDCGNNHATAADFAEAAEICLDNVRAKEGDL